MRVADMVVRSYGLVGGKCGTDFTALLVRCQRCSAGHLHFPIAAVSDQGLGALHRKSIGRCRTSDNCSCLQCRFHRKQVDAPLTGFRSGIGVL